MGLGVYYCVLLLKAEQSWEKTTLICVHLCASW